MIKNRLFFLTILFFVTVKVFALEMPQYIGKYRLISLKTGESAKNDIYMLHRKYIKLADAVVAMYAVNRKEVAYIWLSKSFRQEEAVKQIEVMAEKIKKGSKVYSYPEIIDRQDLKIYKTFGLNMMNYFYNLGKWNVWIAVKTDEPENFLNDFIVKLHERLLNDGK